MRHPRLLVSLFLSIVLYVTSVLVNDTRMSSAPSMTFKWKSRVRLHGHVDERTLGSSKQEEAELLKEQLKVTEGMTLGSSLGSQGLLRIWKKNQQRIIEELQDLIKKETSADDAALISLIRRSLVAPSGGPLKTSHGVRMTSLVDTVDRLLGPTAKGFFIEANVYDGEGASHTLWLEKVRGWRGVLVEPDPDYFLQVLGKNRGAWALNAALSPSTTPSLIVLDDAEHQLGARGGATSGGSRTLVPAYPIHSLLLALNQTHVDFLCLDVGGDEWTVLQTIPWDDITISVIALGVGRSPVDAGQFVELLTKHGYRCYHKPETSSADRKYVTSTPVYVICNKEDPDTYIYQDEKMDFY